MAVTGKRRPVGAPSSAALPPGFRSRLLEGLTPPEIRAVLAAGRQRRISPNQVLQHEGDTGTRFCLLVTGVAAFYKATPEGGKLFLRWITPGDTFGLSAVQAQPQPYLTTVQALRGGSVLVWGRRSACALISHVRRLPENAYAIASAYLVRLADVLVAHASQTAQQRLARVLVESARHIGRDGPEGIELGLTNEQLAHMADVNLFTVSRQLSEWQSERILAKSRGKILLRAPKRLGSQHF